MGADDGRVMWTTHRAGAEGATCWSGEGWGVELRGMVAAAVVDLRVETVGEGCWRVSVTWGVPLAGSGEAGRVLDSREWEVGPGEGGAERAVHRALLWGWMHELKEGVFRRVATEDGQGWAVPFVEPSRDHRPLGPGVGVEESLRALVDASRGTG